MFRKKALAFDRKSEIVKALGEDVEVREMSVRDRVASFSDARVGDALDSALLCFTVMVRSVFQDGNKVFEDDDAVKLADSPFNDDLDKLAGHALRINGLSGKAKEEAEGNS